MQQKTFNTVTAGAERTRSCFCAIKPNDSGLVSGYGTHGVEMSILKSIASCLKVKCTAQPIKRKKKKKVFSQSSR